MGFFGRLLGIEDDADRSRARPLGETAPSHPVTDAQALERYRYMLRTAPAETLEQAHAEAFAKLSPEQRRALLAELTDATPVAERAGVSATSPDDPQALARVATRAEVRQPGVLERSLGSGTLGFGGGLLSSFAMGFVGSMVAQSFFSALGGGMPDLGGASTDANDATDEGALADNSENDGEDFGGDDGGNFDGGDFDV